MAYMSQQKKKELTPAIQAVLKKYSIKGSISVNGNHSTLVVKLLSGGIDFGKTDGSIHHYYIETNYANNQRATSFLKELVNAMQIGNYNNSDIQSGYFDVGWYIEIIVGSYKNHYVFTGITVIEPDPEITHVSYLMEIDYHDRNTFGADENCVTEYEVYKLTKDSNYITISNQLIAVFLHEHDANSFAQYKRQQT